MSRRDYEEFTGSPPPQTARQPAPSPPAPPSESPPSVVVVDTPDHASASTEATPPAAPSGAAYSHDHNPSAEYEAKIKYLEDKVKSYQAVHEWCDGYFHFLDREFDKAFQKKIRINAETYAEARPSAVTQTVPSGMHLPFNPTEDEADIATQFPPDYRRALDAVAHEFIPQDFKQFKDFEFTNLPSSQKAKRYYTSKLLNLPGQTGLVKTISEAMFAHQPPQSVEHKIRGSKDKDKQLAHKYVNCIIKTLPTLYPTGTLADELSAYQTYLAPPESQALQLPAQHNYLTDSHNPSTTSGDQAGQARAETTQETEDRRELQYAIQLSRLIPNESMSPFVRLDP